MSYNDKKFLDQDGLVTLLKKLDNYPTNEILGTVVSAIQMSLGGKVGDVQVNGTSIVNGGIANIPVGNSENFGVYKTSGSTRGIGANSSGILYNVLASDQQIKGGTEQYRTIVPYNQHTSVFYGLATAAGDSTQKESSFAVGKYTDMAKQAIQNMLGITRIVANQETQYEPAVYRHPKGQTFLMNGLLFKALRDIEIGDTVLPEDNCNATNLNYAIFSPKETSILVRPSYLLNKIQDPTLSAQVNSLRANHLAFLPADQIIIEKTTDGGITWEDAEITDAKKVMLFSELRPGGILLPMINGEKNTLCGLRVTFTAMKYDVPENTPETQKYNYWNSNYVLDKERYNTLREFYFWLNSDADTMTIKAERAKGNAADNWETIFENNNARFTGWAGNDYISFEEATFGGGVNQASQPWNYRLTFMTAYKTDFNEFNQTFVTSPQSLYEIRGYGASCWTQGNNYAGTDHLYSFDRDQNAYFPKSVNANNFNGTINGYDVRKNVPANAIFTDTTYNSLAAASGGTAVSLVTTGEKYTWNQKVGDVQVNGSSIISNGVANIPLAQNDASAAPGLVKIYWGGLQIDSKGYLRINPATAAEIKAGTASFVTISPANQGNSTFYGLATAAGDTTQKDSPNTLGTYTDTAKQKIQNMLGITDLLSTEESSTATAAHALNSTFMMNGKLYKATAAIVIGDAVVEGQNCEAVKADEVFVKNTDYADANNYGLVKVGGNGITINNTSKIIQIDSANSNQIKAQSNGYAPITPLKQHEAVYYGLSRIAGVSLNTETVTVGTYPETSKTAIRSLIGAIGTTDYATSTTGGTVRINTANGVNITNDGQLFINQAATNNIKQGTANYFPIVPSHQHEAAFYGLAKAAGADMSSSSNAVGTYTESAKTAIRSMIGATSSNVIAVQDTQPVEADAKIWMMETAPESVEIPTMEDLAGYVQKTNIATSSTCGIIKTNANFGTAMRDSPNQDTLMVAPAGEQNIKEGVQGYQPIVPSRQHISVYYGLSRLAGVNLANETVTVGTYPETSKTAIRTMLGAVGDVQVDGTSVVSNGVANIPVASMSTFGVLKIGDVYTGLQKDTSGYLKTACASSSYIKAGTDLYRPIVSGYQHEATFYGLAKAAGDATQSASSNAVGTYTTEAKAAIHTMLGIDPASIAAQVDIPLVETVSGTTPTITGQPNVRYVCGEVSTITITPPASGSVDVIFESGSTATAMTVPSTVKWPAWFNAETLEANTIYEILITDGIYGSVMTWAT